MKYSKILFIGLGSMAFAAYAVMPDQDFAIHDYDLPLPTRDPNVKEPGLKEATAGLSCLTLLDPKKQKEIDKMMQEFREAEEGLKSSPNAEKKVSSLSRKILHKIPVNLRFAYLASKMKTQVEAIKPLPKANQAEYRKLYDEGTILGEQLMRINSGKSSPIDFEQLARYENENKKLAERIAKLFPSPEENKHKVDPLLMKMAIALARVPKQTLVDIERKNLEMDPAYQAAYKDYKAAQQKLLEAGGNLRLGSKSETAFNQAAEALTEQQNKLLAVIKANPNLKDEGKRRQQSRILRQSKVAFEISGKDIDRAQANLETEREENLDRMSALMGFGTFTPAGKMIRNYMERTLLGSPVTGAMPPQKPRDQDYCDLATDPNLIEDQSSSGILRTMSAK